MPVEKSEFLSWLVVECHFKKSLNLLDTVG